MRDEKSSTVVPVAGQLISELLGRGLEVRVRVTGESMRPLLGGGELATVVPAPPPSLRLGDLVLWRGAEGCLVLHRVVRLTGHGEGRRCWTRGDALAAHDESFGADRVLGRVSRIEGLRLPGAPAAVDTGSRYWRSASRCCLAVARLRVLAGRVRGGLARLT